MSVESPNMDSMATTASPTVSIARSGRKRKASDTVGEEQFDESTANPSSGPGQATAEFEHSSTTGSGGTSNPRIWTASKFGAPGGGIEGGGGEGVAVTRHGPWTKEEDEALLAAYEDFKHSRKGRPHWVLISRQLGEVRLPEACRLRFKHVLEPRMSGIVGIGAWTKEEDASLTEAFELYRHAGRAGAPDWARIAEAMGGRRSSLAYRQRYTSVLAPRMNKLFKGPWTKNEDDALIAAFDEFKNARRNGQPDWKAIAARMGDERLPKAYRQRYTAVLVPRRLTACANHGAWTTQEDAALMAAYEECKHAGREGGVDWIGVSERMGSTRSALAARTHFVNVLMPKNLQEKQLGQWDPQEDALLIHAYEEFKTAGKEGGVNWSAIAERLGNRRAASACRMRFIRTFAHKALNHAGWTPELDEALLDAFAQFEHSGPAGRPCMKSIAGAVGSGLKPKQCMLRLRELLPPSASVLTSSSSSMDTADAALSHALHAAGMGGDASHIVSGIADRAVAAPAVSFNSSSSSSSSSLSSASGSDDPPDTVGDTTPPLPLPHQLSVPTSVLPVSVPLSAWTVVEPVQINI